MIDFIIFWAFATYGMTTILVYGSIFNKPRNFIKRWSENQYTPFQYVGKFMHDLISCMLCTSTWVGFFFSISLGGLSRYIVNLSSPYSIFFDGMFTAGIVWAINGIVEFFEESRIK
jgi:hypothetical protein